MAKASVILPARNCENTIKQCISSILGNEFKDFELIVVDDASQDSTLEIIRSFDDVRITILENKECRGASYSRNKGIKKACAPLLLLVDSDAYVEKEWMAKHLAIHEGEDRDIVGGPIKGIHKSIYGLVDYFTSTWTSIPESNDYFVKKLHLPTNNMSIKRYVFERIGFFDEALICGGEDAEFCFRAQKAGLYVFFSQQPLVFHYDRDDFKSLIDHQRKFGKHVVEMRTKHQMDYAYIIPKTHFQAILYILPLAVLYTGFIISRWVRYRPEIILLSPLIFISKIAQTISIKDSLK